MRVLTLSRVALALCVALWAFLSVPVHAATSYESPLSVACGSGTAFCAASTRKGVEEVRTAFEAALVAAGTPHNDGAMYHAYQCWEGWSAGGGAPTHFGLSTASASAWIASIPSTPAAGYVFYVGSPGLYGSGPNIDLPRPCSEGITSFAGSFSLAIQCSNGSFVTNPSSCATTTCASISTKAADWKLTFSGAGTPAPLTTYIDGIKARGYVCGNFSNGASCRISTQTANCDALTLSGSGSPYTQVTCEGTGLIQDALCEALDRNTLVMDTSATRVPQLVAGGSSGGASAVSGGGAGATGGTNGVDSTNTARIATNTQQIVDQLRAGIAVTGGGSSGGTSIDEGSTATSAATTVTNMAGAEADMKASMDAVKGAIGYDANRFGTAEGRHTFSLGFFMGSGATTCELDVGPITIPMVGGGAHSITLNSCAWGGKVRDILTWFFGVLTAFGLWAILFNRGA